MTPLALIGTLLPSVPSIAKLLGMSDNATKVAETVSKVAQAVTGKTNEQEAAEAILANPEELLRFKIAIAETEKELEVLYAKDKESARQRDLELMRNGRKNFRADYLVGFLTVLLVLLLCAVILTDLNDFAKGMITTIAGFVTSQLANVFSFEFGTTRKEDENNKSILQDYIKSPTK